MAPSPENDNTPKAPDKNEKTKGDKHGSVDIIKEKNKDFKTLNNLNDCELKDLLDEAITYKNPKDREGKSTLFKELLSQAEESERNARAASAGGSEQVRYCNTTAKRSKHRRKPNSISENVMHGGSLDNLAKEELFEVAHHLNRSKRTVSARQREGGSLPSNVNSGGLASYDPHFLEEARKKRMTKGSVIVAGGGPSFESMDVDMERVSLLEHDSVAENFNKESPASELIENAPPQQIAPKFTTKATLQVNVDDALHFNDLETVEKKPYEIEQISAKVLQSKYSVYIPNYNPLNEATKKVDENGNALQQNTTSKNKKKKVQSDKNVVSCVAAEKVEGHRSDIINDVKKLLEYIGENKPQGGTTKTNAHRSSKQLHKHTSEEGPRNSKKQRAQSSKGKENRSELKKSNSLGEISTVKLENFNFSGKDNDNTDVTEPPVKQDEVTLRVKKETSVDKPRDRRSCGNVEHPAMQNFHKNTNQESVETSSSSDFRVVTKKKKTKKRRNSVSGSRRKMSTAASNGANSSKSDGDRASSPTVVRRKSTCSVPPSDRSNDSSDVDSVHSLPIDTSQRLESSLNADDGPISYAAIARNSERKTSHETHKTSSPDSKSSNSKENSPVSITTGDPTSPEMARSKIISHLVSDTLVAEAVLSAVQNTPTKVAPPDVHNIKSFPSIHASSNKLDRLPKAESKTSCARAGANKLHVGQQNMVQYNNAANITRNSRILSGNVSNEELESQDDIQNNLSIIQASEMEAVQHNSQIMPTMQIPDVQTIEKMHFMNQPGGRMPPHLQQHVLPTQHVQIAPQPMHPIPVIPITDIFTDGCPPSTYTAVISHTPHQPGGLAYVKTAQAYEGMRMTQLDQTSYHTAQKGSPKEGLNSHIVPNTVDNQNILNNNIVTQTTNVDAKRKDSISGKINEDDNTNSASTKHSKFSKRSLFPNEASSVSSGSRDCSVSMTSSVAKGVRISSVSDLIANSNTSSTSLSGEGLYQQSSSQTGTESSTRDVSATICDNRTNTSDSEDSPRPPVVILSGLNSSKEVTSGLVFGFDVNEQLLSEDICENFVQRYVNPVSYTETSHNHDKIVNYIGLAWDDVRRSHSSGKAQYYSESP